MAQYIFKEQKNIIKKVARKSKYLTKRLQELVANFQENHRKLLGMLKADVPYHSIQEDTEAQVGALRTLIGRNQAKIYEKASERESAGHPLGTSAANIEDRAVSTFPDELSNL